MKVKFVFIGILLIVLTYLTLPNANLSDKVFADNGNGSTIAGINVSGLKEKEIKKALKEAIDQWKSEPVILTGGGIKLEIDPAKIEFDVDRTISQFKSISSNPWYAFWKKEKVVHIPLEVKLNDELKNEIAKYTIWKTDETYEQLQTVSSYLKGHEVEAVVKDLSIYENERLSVAIEKIPDEIIGVNPIAEAINEYVVNPMETFSFNQVIEEKVGNANRDTLSFVASVLYSSILETELEIVERHQQSAVPSYIDAGREAQVDLVENKDLKFYNNTGHVAKIKATVQNNKLKVEIYSDVKGKKVTVTVEEEIIKPRIITRYSRDLAAGESKIVQKGQEGLRVNVFRTISGDGETVDDLIDRSYYPPKNRIVLKSTRSDSSPENEVVNAPTAEEVDLDGDGLPDVKGEESPKESVEEPAGEENLPQGSYYDKGGNLITP